MSRPSSVVHRIHFEDFGGPDFERLVFAYHLRAAWTDVAWYGQNGSDQGRDIIGTELFDGELPRRTVIQCVNRNAITQSKAEDDLGAAFAAPTGPPERLQALREDHAAWRLPRDTGSSALPVLSRKRRYYYEMAAGGFPPGAFRRRIS